MIKEKKTSEPQINKFEMQSSDFVSENENIDKLMKLFPELITEISDGVVINIDVLKTLVGDRTVTDADEKYGLTWHGKLHAHQLALTRSNGTLRPFPEESATWDTTQNLMIEGDNLEVLKLLHKSYENRVKLIYIDPPYNTGKDFVYPDNFQDNIKNYRELTKQTESGDRLSSNAESDGRFHTKWLNMMYPRLKLAQGLLTQDGAIFISCDETEQPRLRMMMDEIFGQENFIADMVWAAGRKNDSRLISVSHEYIICYARNHGTLTEKKIEWRQRKRGLEDIYAQHERLKRRHGTDYAAMTAGMKEWYRDLPDNHPAKAHKHYCQVDARGVYFNDNISWPGGGGPKYEVLHPKTKKPVAVPSRGWMTSNPEKMKAWIADDLVHFGIDETSVPCIKSYLKDREYQAPYSVFYQDGRAATKRLRALMGSRCFDFPKDETVLQEIFGMMTSENDIVLDCFAGSGTTGHSVMTLNANDGGGRRHILVQFPEPLDPKNNKQKSAAEYCDKLGKPRNLAELTKERLRRAARKIKENSHEYDGDLGFRVFKLDSTNIREWESKPEKLENSLRASVDHIKSDRSEEDIFYELLLRFGLDLCIPIEKRSIVGKDVYSTLGGGVMACLTDKINDAEAEKLALGIAEWYEELGMDNDSTCVFRDSAFASDMAKTNLSIILKQHGILHVRSL